MANYTCPACNNKVEELVKHHWYELPDVVLHSKEICRSCNIILATYRFYPRRFYREHKQLIHHILPAWEEQSLKVAEIIQAQERWEQVRQQRKRQAKQLRMQLRGIRKGRDTVIIATRIKNDLLTELNDYTSSINESRNSWVIGAIQDFLESGA